VRRRPVSFQVQDINSRKRQMVKEHDEMTNPSHGSLSKL
jgi:hypothetical protein